jgi:phage/plasmid-associated DNA primase
VYWRAFGESESVVVAETATEVEARSARRYYMAGFAAGLRGRVVAETTEPAEPAEPVAVAEEAVAEEAVAEEAVAEEAVAEEAVAEPTEQAEQAKPARAAATAQNTVTALVPYMPRTKRNTPKVRVMRTAPPLHPSRLAVANGVLHFAGNTVTLHPHDSSLAVRAGRFGRHDAIPYEPSNTSHGDLLKFLKDLFPDPDVLEYTLCAVASCLDGVRRTPNLFLCHGQGSSGKSAFQSLVEMTLGDYATTVQPEILCRKSQLEAIRHQVAGRRWIGVGEPSPGSSLHVGTLQTLLESHAAHVFLFTCELPPLKADDAFWKKVRVLPFLTVFADPGSTSAEWTVPRDLHLQEKLPGWRSAFLALLISRFTAATAFPRAEPDRVHDATLLYRRTNDPYMQFVSEYLIPDDDAPLIAPSTLRALWREFRKSKALGPVLPGDLKESDVLERLVDSDGYMRGFAINRTAAVPER